jgi:hypothetical protein
MVVRARIRISIRRRYGAGSQHDVMHVLVVEDDPYMAEAIRDGLRLEAIAADIAGDGDTATITPPSASPPRRPSLPRPLSPVKVVM